MRRKKKKNGKGNTMRPYQWKKSHWEEDYYRFNSHKRPQITDLTFLWTIRIHHLEWHSLIFRCATSPFLMAGEGYPWLPPDRSYS
ncbi:hypothetical protein CEXT_598061 [Caerostris extrusa]|uniref:Uncharacterized protein n=1 Tax=Caerostris extrusa TaxID=172846 RepID=A0AAV4NSE9_CAEEX|nr:hypothetical protein CEXT_598061 [Caerostris extrusa]